jgi:hypothetical protein
MLSREEAPALGGRQYFMVHKIITNYYSSDEKKWRKRKERRRRRRKRARRPVCELQQVMKYSKKRKIEESALK